MGPRQLVALDLGSGSTRVVVLSRRKQHVHWDAAFNWPCLNEDMTFGPNRKTLAEMFAEARIAAEYVSVITSSGGTLIRLINFPGRPPDGEMLLTQVRQALGVDDSYMVHCQIVQELTKEKDGRDEFAAFSAALPAARVNQVYDWVEGAGLKPVSMRASGTSMANLVRETKGLLKDGTGVGVLEIGHGSSMLFIFLGQDLVLARQFKLGSGVLVEHLRTSFELDEATAAKFFVSGSFDFSANIRPLIAPWLHQLAISLDFFERRYGRSVESVAVFGGGAQSKVMETLIAGHIRRPLVRWNPMEALQDLPAPASLTSNDWGIFASAAGEAARVIRGGGRKA